MKTWFKNLKRGARSALVFALIASMSIGAYAAVNFLWGKAHGKPSITQDIVANPISAYNIYGKSEKMRLPEHFRRIMKGDESDCVE